MKARCFDPDFKYVPAAATDISKTFARIRREMAAQAKIVQQSNVKAIAPKKVVVK